MNPLKPYTKTDLTDALIFEVEAFKSAPDELLIEYRLKGSLDKIRFPDLTLVESRLDELWKHTCLEAFFAESDDDNSPYFEINCSPNGDWNAYAFSSYRQGMRPSESLRVKLVAREGHDREALFRVRVSGDDLKKAHHLGITAVVEFADGSRSFFALAHPGAQPDFHLRKACLISL